MSYIDEIEQSKEDKTDEEIIKFLELNPSSQYGSIWNHIQELRDGGADLVSQKIFDRRLKRLCANDDARVTKTTSGVDADDRNISERMPRYSITEDVQAETLREIHFSDYLDSMSDRIRGIEKNFKILNDEELAVQFFYFYSKLNLLSLIWRIKLERDLKKLRRSYQAITFKKILPQKMEEVSLVMNKLPEERKKKIHEKVWQKVADQNRVTSARLLPKSVVRQKLPEWDLLQKKRWDEANPEESNKRKKKGDEILLGAFASGLFGQPGSTLCEACKKPIRRHSDKQRKVCERKIKSKKVKK